MKRRRIVAFILAGILGIGLYPRKMQAEAVSSEMTAPSAILMEAGSGKILYEKDADVQRPCASITKVMTLLLVMEALDSGKIQLTDMVTASEHAASMGGSDIWLEPGETMSVDDLLKATVIASANDAAVALAEYVAGSEENFLVMMNQRAQELGMTQTVFKNCNGLDEEGHLTSARDVAIMSRELIRYEKIFDYTQTWIDYVRDGKTQLVNTNKLLKSYSGITGLKTGTTGQAGSCITATAQRDGVSLIAVVLGCSNTNERFTSAAALLDEGFANWAIAQPSLPPQELQPVAVEQGMTAQVPVSVELGQGIVVPKGRQEELEYEVVVEEAVQAPVTQGQILGKVIYRLDGETLAEYPVKAAGNVEEITFASVWHWLLCRFFSVSPG